MSLLELNDIKKKFGNTQVLDGVNLSVEEGEFITLLGSSGCGKTTTLRIIAGLESPDSGQIILSGTDVSSLAPEKRNVSTVFQNYALFPHMNVETNIGYGLRLRKKPKSEIRDAVTKVLSLVRLAGFQNRMPSELSGGQCQRVAIARAIIVSPKVLLLDEPLGALDLTLRRQMQNELKILQKKLGITFVYITHDQEEALNMSDRIALMRDGRFEQVACVADIYDRPKTSYAAKFVGNSNVLTGNVLSLQGDKIVLSRDGGIFLASKQKDGDGFYAVNEKIAVAVKSENVHIVPCSQNSSKEVLIGEISSKTFTGGLLRISAVLPDGNEITASRHGIDFPLSIGETVAIYWDYKKALQVRWSGI
ncbi:MAG: ABC transporter ATP-binding protein [Endomicrobium sp.]|jgi:spermidine/putrescine transport system ATP-binding protein|nr:ABC transporter ATP-binding protein [Endomicrobium sp.]